MSNVPLAERVRARVRDIPDFPTPGILFRDITPVLADAVLFRDVVSHFAQRFAPLQPDAVVAIESRGFIIGAPLAIALGIPFVPVRKPGKLPWQKIRVDYQLEYGTDALEAHLDAVSAGQRVLIIDDLLATGGTAQGTVDLVRKLGGDVVGCGFIIELAPLGGRARLNGIPIEALLAYS